MYSGLSGNSVFHNGDVLRIVRPDRRCEDDEIDVRRDVLLLLADNDLDAVCSQFIRNGRSGAVGSGDLKPSAAKDLRETAHGDSADPRKKDVDWLVKIELIHMSSLNVLIVRSVVLLI